MNLFQALLQPWTWRLAWRDSRSSRRRLFLYSLSISLGIAALVAVGSLGQSLRRAVDEQSKALLGADLVVSSRKPFGEAEEALLQRLGKDRSDEISFASMLSFPAAGGTRLINVRALRGPFPWYGSFEADPPSSVEAFRNGEGLLVEEGVARQFNAQVGDPVKLGEWNTRIVGLLRSVPGDSFAFATLAPRVYMAFDRLDTTQLLGRGSLVRYRSLFRLPEDPVGKQWIEELRDPLKELRLDIDTAEKRREDLGRTASNLNGFLNLVAFIALLLGAVGVASAVQVHVRQRLPQVAVLRCLGAPMAATFAVYLIQAVALGAVGVLTGIALGALVQRAVPAAFASLLPFPIDVRFSFSAAAQAAVAGLVVSSTFALLPLLEVRRVSPLAAIRVAFDPGRAGRDPARWLVIAAIAGAVLTFALLQTREVRHGLGFAAGLATAFLLLAGAARLLVILSRRLVPTWLPFAWRQGLASLHRPQNRTGTLLVSLGLGTFLILSLQLTRASLLQSLSTPPGERRANAILFDVQPDQVEGVGDILQRLNLPLVDGAAIVTMRLSSLKDRPVSEWLTNSTEDVPGWVLRREYRSTWRSNLVDSERLLRGTLSPRIDPGTTPVPVSVESGIAKDLGIDLGDRLTFDVQGVPLDCVVGSIREVEWRQVRPNFFVVFPDGALEAAPSMHILATSISNATESAILQREVVGEFPNVSVIDLTLVLSTVEGVVSKVALAIRFMTLFTIGTGIVVLAGAVVTGRWQRMQEAILLRTLGASQAQIRRILIAEYAGLGILAALTGSLLALGSGWALAHFLFKVPFHIQPSDLFLTLITVPLLTVIVGLAASRGISSHPPLEILRRES
jgi:putative ABC transport system permease protein